MSALPLLGWAVPSPIRVLVPACHGNVSHERRCHANDRSCALAQPNAFSRRPLSRASRPFIGPILKGRKGSIPAHPTGQLNSGAA